MFDLLVLLLLLLLMQLLSQKMNKQNHLTETPPQQLPPTPSPSQRCEVLNGPSPGIDCANTWKHHEHKNNSHTSHTAPAPPAEPAMYMHWVCRLPHHFFAMYSNSCPIFGFLLWLSCLDNPCSSRSSSILLQVVHLASASTHFS